MFSDRWNCDTCQRGNHKCPYRDEIDREELYERIQWEAEGREPMIYTADRLGICPRCLVTDWGGYVWQAYQWQESGGDLGVSFVDCPGWLIEAFNLLAGARYEANKVKNIKP